MGDKISALPSATSVDGTELVPIVQGGATKKVTGLILRNPAGAASGDLTGNYPNPTLAAITTGQVAVGSSSVIPVITTDAKGRVTALTTAVNPALTTNQIAGLSTAAGAVLATAGAVGLSTFAARADHQHARPTPAEIGALGATAAAGGDLVGNFPNPTLATITSAQSNVGSGTAIPVISVDAKGRVTNLATTNFSALTTAQIAGLATTAPSALATSAAVGLSTFAARADHQHPFPTAAQVGALGATATAGGDLTGSYPVPTLAAITTAQSNVGSSTVVPVLSVDAKGRVTSLTTAAIAGGSGSGITALTGDVLASGTGSVAATLAAITTAQTNIGSGTQIPVLSIDAKGRVTGLSTTPVSLAGGDATSLQTVAISTSAPAIGSVLEYNGLEWIPTAPSLNAVELQNYPISEATPIAGQALVYSGSQWEPTSPVVPEWNSTTNYYAGDIVARYGVIYKATSSSTNVDPVGGTGIYWVGLIPSSSAASFPNNPSNVAIWISIVLQSGQAGYIPVYQ